MIITKYTLNSNDKNINSMFCIAHHSPFTPSLKIIELHVIKAKKNK